MDFVAENSATFCEAKLGEEIAEKFTYDSGPCFAASVKTRICCANTLQMLRICVAVIRRNPPSSTTKKPSHKAWFQVVDSGPSQSCAL